MQIYLRFFCVNQKKVVSLRVFWKILYVMIKEIPDFPKPGIRFLEITPFLLNPDEVREAISAFCEQIKPLTAEGQVLIIGPDARGFIFSAMVAYELHQPLFMLRKAGKLPNDGTQVTFKAAKEYGASEFAVNVADLEALKASGCTNAVIVDDILATGFTNLTIAQFFTEHGFKVHKVLNLIEINGLGGRDVIEKGGFPVYSFIKHDE